MESVYDSLFVNAETGGGKKEEWSHPPILTWKWDELVAVQLKSEMRLNFEVFILYQLGWSSNLLQSKSYKLCVK